MTAVSSPEVEPGNWSMLTLFSIFGTCIALAFPMLEAAHGHSLFEIVMWC